jgi:hypothetical protein
VGKIVITGKELYQNFITGPFGTFEKVRGVFQSAKELVHGVRDFFGGDGKAKIGEHIHTRQTRSLESIAHSIQQIHAQSFPNFDPNAPQTIYDENGGFTYMGQRYDHVAPSRRALDRNLLEMRAAFSVLGHGEDPNHKAAVKSTLQMQQQVARTQALITQVRTYLTLVDKTFS